MQCRWREGNSHQVVYLATYYSLTTQCNAAYVANGWCNVLKCYATEIDGIEDEI